jgi:hypothetical protein
MARSGSKITTETLKSLEPGGIAWDSVVRGFGVRRRATSISLLKTQVRGRRLWQRIGDTGTWSPTAARREAQWLLMVLLGEPELLTAWMSAYGAKADIPR